MSYQIAPWTIIDTVPGNEIGYRAILDADGFTVCDLSPMGEANARLIAAAPDLLAALRDMVDAFGHYCEGDASDDERVALLWAMEIISQATEGRRA